MLLQFTLSMPNRGSWNGRWSGENNLYAVVRNVSDAKKHADKYSKLAGGTFYYRWDDGWGAAVSVSKVDAPTARRVRKASKGFCGYEWMIDSILDRGEIIGKCIHKQYTDMECKRCVAEVY